MRPVLFYLSGHGYGHAVRAIEVIRALRADCPQRPVFVRTTVPESLFDRLPPGSVRCQRTAIDSAVIETPDTLQIDLPATLRRLRELVADCGSLVKREVEFIRREGIAQIVADIPFLAGEIAASAGVGCIGIGNFTWDWILEPYLADTPEDRQLLDILRRGYAHMDAILRLPMSPPMDECPRVIDVPLVTPSSQRSREEIRRAIGIGGDDPRTVVYFATRGAISVEALRAAAQSGPEFLFVYTNQEKGDSSLPENAQAVTIGGKYSFVDVVHASDVVVSKLGYGTLSACIVSGTAILHPPRVGFREEEILGPESRRYARSLAISAADFHAGRWPDSLRKLLRQPPPASRLETDGDRVCAGFIARG